MNSRKIERNLADTGSMTESCHKNLKGGNYRGPQQTANYASGLVRWKCV
jgi:hypothetical protein